MYPFTSSPPVSPPPSPPPPASIYSSPTLQNPLLTIPSTILLAYSSRKLWNQFGRVVKNAEELNLVHLKGGRGKRMRGEVTSVGDADNFRLYHRPTLSWSRRSSIKAPSSRLGLKDQTIHVRLAGIDAPELAHFGNPAQPYSQEALTWLTQALLGKKVSVDLYSKDRYGRIVGMCYTRPFPYLFRKNISEEMLKVGLASVYTAGGAIHAGMKERFIELEEQAKKSKKGMWAQSISTYESPGDYKKRVAALSGGGNEEKDGKREKEKDEKKFKDHDGGKGKEKEKGRIRFFG